MENTYCNLDLIEREIALLAVRKFSTAFKSPIEAIASLTKPELDIAGALETYFNSYAEQIQYIWANAKYFHKLVNEQYAITSQPEHIQDALKRNLTALNEILTHAESILGLRRAQEVVEISWSAIAFSMGVDPWVLASRRGHQGANQPVACDWVCLDGVQRNSEDCRAYFNELIDNGIFAIQYIMLNPFIRKFYIGTKETADINAVQYSGGGLHSINRQQYVRWGQQRWMVGSSPITAELPQTKLLKKMSEEKLIAKFNAVEDDRFANYTKGGASTVKTTMTEKANQQRANSNTITAPIVHKQIYVNLPSTRQQTFEDCLADLDANFKKGIAKVMEVNRETRLWETRLL